MKLSLVRILRDGMVFIKFENGETGETIWEQKLSQGEFKDLRLQIKKARLEEKIDRHHLNWEEW